MSLKLSLMRENSIWLWCMYDRIGMVWEFSNVSWKLLVKMRVQNSCVVCFFLSLERAKNFNHNCIYTFGVHFTKPSLFHCLYLFEYFVRNRKILKSMGSWESGMDSMWTACNPELAESVLVHGTSFCQAIIASIIHIRCNWCDARSPAKQPASKYFLHAFIYYYRCINLLSLKITTCVPVLVHDNMITVSKLSRQRRSNRLHSICIIFVSPKFLDAPISMCVLCYVLALIAHTDTNIFAIQLFFQHSDAISLHNFAERTSSREFADEIICSVYVHVPHQYIK